MIRLHSFCTIKNILNASYDNLKNYENSKYATIVQQIKTI